MYSNQNVRYHNDINNKRAVKCRRRKVANDWKTQSVRSAVPVYEHEHTHAANAL